MMDVVMTLKNWDALLVGVMVVGFTLQVVVGFSMIIRNKRK